MGFFSRGEKNKQKGYPLQWVSPQLAVGPAPQPYQIEELKQLGLDAILNLGLELEPLADLEREEGFEVKHVPLVDEDAPDLEELENILEWLDEAIYLGKKVLIHCRFGIGRTGTLLYSYLLRRGWGQKRTKRFIKRLRSQPANAEQARLLRKYGKQEGSLSVREPSLGPENFMDLSPYFSELEKCWQKLESFLDANSLCGRDHDRCCHDLVRVSLIEAVYILRMLNKKLDSETRKNCMQEGLKAGSKLRGLAKEHDFEDLERVFPETGIKCPLNEDKKCLLLGQRPLVCRLAGQGLSGKQEVKALKDDVETLSSRVIEDLSEGGAEKYHSAIYLFDVVSGRFVQDFFHFLAKI